MNAPLPPFDEAAVEHRYAQLRQVRLHYVAAGPPEGPLVVLLHGFPEFWYAWRHQLSFLAQQGFRAIAPDMRGYNLSDKPAGVVNYELEALTDDVAQLVEAVGRDTAIVVGHDWGGLVAWWTAIRHPRLVDRLCVMNCPHPGHAHAMLTDPRQLRRSWYILYFQLPRLPERMIAARDFAMLRATLRKEPRRRGAFTDEDIERYVHAFRTGSVTPALDYYRALMRRGPLRPRALRPIELPTQVIWGVQDKHLGLDYAEPPAKWVWDLRLDLVDDASHFVQADRPDRVNELLAEFLA